VLADLLSHDGQRHLIGGPSRSRQTGGDCEHGHVRKMFRKLAQRGAWICFR
jgi:hypothetical protein